MENNGWIKIHRKILDNPKICQNSDYMNLWIHILLYATHSERPKLFNGKNIILKPGQFITGRKFLSEVTGINESKVERILKYLESEQQIEQQKTTTNRLITITKWKEYQDIEQPFEQRVNNERTTSEQRVNTYKNDKNVNNVKNEKKRTTGKAFIYNFPESLNNDTFLKSWSEWIVYKKETRNNFNSQKTIDKQIAFLSTEPEKAVAIINQAIQNGWKGLYPLKENNNGTTQQRQKNGFGNNSKFGESELERQRQIANELLAERGYQTIEPAGSNSDTGKAI